MSCFFSGWIDYVFCAGNLGKHNINTCATHKNKKTRAALHVFLKPPSTEEQKDSSMDQEKQTNAMDHDMHPMRKSPLEMHNPFHPDGYLICNCSIGDRPSMSCVIQDILSRSTSLTIKD